MSVDEDLSFPKLHNAPLTISQNFTSTAVRTFVRSEVRGIVSVTKSYKLLNLKRFSDVTLKSISWLRYFCPFW